MSEPEKMTFDQCMAVIKQFDGWNHGQKSIPLSFHGTRTTEDDIYDTRREMILKVNARLKELAE